MTLQRYEHQGAAPSTNLSVSMASGDTSFTIASGTGYPTGAGGKLFVIAVDPGQPSEEKILCSARAGTSVTVSGGVAGRGYDGTSAASHTAPTAVVEHVVAAAEIDDNNDHLYTTSRDDHTQYAKADGTRAFTGGITVTGNSSVTGTLTASSTVQGTAHIATLTGTNGRYVGATNGAPSSGTYSTADFADDPTNVTFWICTSGGTPGTWKAVGDLYRARAYRNGTFNAASSPTQVIFDTVTFDPSSSYNNSTGFYTVPLTGVYRTTAQVGYAAVSGAWVQVSLMKNTSTTLTTATAWASASSGLIPLSAQANDLLSLSTSDTVSVNASSSGAGSPAGFHLSEITYFDIERVA